MLALCHNYCTYFLNFKLFVDIPKVNFYIAISINLLFMIFYFILLINEKI